MYKARPLIPPSDPRAMNAYVIHYLEYLTVKAYSASLIGYRHSILVQFCAWLQERGITRLTEVTRPILDRYARHLHHTITPFGKPLTIRSQINRLISIRRFFRWLVQQNHLLYNPASDLELPRKPKTLPREVLTAAEVELVLAQADTTTLLGIRDRAIMEVLYSTGIRRAELIHLSITDVQASRGVVVVREGKGKKDRYVPIGERALLWVQKYLDEVRPEFALPASDPHVLFLTENGTSMYKNHLGIRVKRYVEKANVGKKGSCHLFRHTMATLMLENGADIRFIQQLLGHSDLSTTEVYTHVAIHKLKAVHALTHPAKLPEALQSRLLAARHDATAQSEHTPTAADVLAQLAAETEEETNEDE